MHTDISKVLTRAALMGGFNSRFHGVLIAAYAIYGVLAAAIWIATCELSDTYQFGINAIHNALNPLWSWLAMLIASLIFGLIEKRLWVLRQLRIGLWSSCLLILLSWLVLLLFASDRHQFPPAQTATQTIIRSLLRPSLTGASFAVAVSMSMLLLQSALVCGWLELCFGGQARLAWRRLHLFFYVFVLPVMVLAMGLVLVNDRLSEMLILVLIHTFFAAPTLYLASSLALWRPSIGAPLLVIAAVLTTVPISLVALSADQLVWLAMPVSIICATVGVLVMQCED